MTASRRIPLGGAALLNVGTTTGTVAAGDDSRFGVDLVTGTAGHIIISDGTNWVSRALLLTDFAGVTAWKPTGLTGAVAASRYAGATISGAPTSGTFQVGDFVIDQRGYFWVCAAAGTPGTWRLVGGQIVARASGWAALPGVKATIALGSTTVNKVYASRIPREHWGRTVTELGINQTVAPVTAGGKATAVTIRLALAADVSGVPDTAIVVGSEVTIDALTAAPTGGLHTALAAGVIAPPNGWILFACQPTGGDGTLTTYPTVDDYNSHQEGIVGTTTAPPTGFFTGYSESGQTTTATMVGATLPAIVTTVGGTPRAMTKAT